MRCGPLAAGGSTLTGAPSAPLYPHPLERRVGEALGRCDADRWRREAAR
jgi:hypothetical protein